MSPHAEVPTSTMGPPTVSTRRQSIWAATRNLVTTNSDQNIASTRQLKKATKAKTKAAWKAQQGELGSTQDSDPVYADADAISSTASLTSDTTNPRGSSTLLTNSLGGSRLSLVAESATSSSPDPKAKASVDGLRASNSTSSSQDQEDLEAVVTPSVRRRSFFTPGVATRVKSRNTLRKPPPPEQARPQTDKDYHHNHHFPEPSPLPQLADLGNTSEPHYSRTATPSEPTYSHLAGLRQGTLRITNGAASPVLSVRIDHVQQVAPEVEKEEMYHTASEGRASEENAIEMVPEKSSEDCYFAGEYAAAGYNTGQGDRRETLATPSSGSTPQCESPREFESWSQTMESDSDDEPKDTKGKVLMKRRSLSLFEFPAWTNDRASSMAERYMDELPNRPFSRGGATETFGAGHVGPSHERSQDDEGIVIASYRDSIASNTDTSPPTMQSESGARAEALSILEGSASSRPQSEVRPAMPSRYTWDAASNVANHGVDAKHVSKADSGYSSKESLHSLQNDSHNDHEVDARGKALPQEPHSTTSATASQPTMPRRLAPAVPLKSLANATVIVPGQVSNFSASPKSNKEYMGTVTHISSEPMTTMGVKETNPTHVPRKLQKPRRLSQTMLETAKITVQACKQIQPSQIPAVPSNVAAKHAERLSKFPTLGHTFPSLDHTSSKESLSAEALVDVPIRFPSPSDGDHSDHNGRTGRSREQSGKAPSCHAQDAEQVPKTRFFRARSKSRQRSASRHRSGSQTASTPNIGDFGTVTESLGPSPYDVAASTVKVPPSDLIEQPRASSHQVGNPMPQAKSITGMDEAPAAVVANERSQPRNLSRAKNFSRPRSAHDKSFDDRGGIPGKLPRPTSLIIFDAPPVPSLPAAAHSLQTAGPRDQPLRSHQYPRPSSWFAEAPVQAPRHEEARKPTVAKGPNRSHQPLRDDVQPQRSETMGIDNLSPANNTDRIVPQPPPNTQAKRPSMGFRSSTVVAPEQRNKRLPEPPRISDAEALEVSQDWETAKRAWQQRRKSLAEGLQPESQIVTPSQKVRSPARSPTRRPRYYASGVTATAGDNLARAKSSDVLATPSHPQSATPLPTAIPSTDCPSQIPIVTSDISKPAPKDVSVTRSTNDRRRSRSAKPRQRPLPRAESFAHIPYSESDTLKPAREDVPRTKSADVARPKARPQSARPAPRAIARTESLDDISYRGNDISEPAKDHVRGSRSFERSKSKAPTEGLLNRYGGGLAFDYEPGLGVGGSAGQRNAQSKARRKSVDISMSHGVDLSDIPVFINF